MSSKRVKHFKILVTSQNIRMVLASLAFLVILTNVFMRFPVRSPKKTHLCGAGLKI